MGFSVEKMGRKVKYEPYVPADKAKNTLPLDVQVKKFVRNNKLLVGAAAGVFVIYVLGMFFGRTRVASSFASGQGFEFDSSTDYKLHKRLSVFETLSRGTRQYAFNAMKGNIPFSDDGKQASVQACDFSYTESRMTSMNKRVARSEKVHELTAMLFQAPNLAIKSLLVSPRDMVLDVDEGTPEARVDPDVEDVMTADKNEETPEDEDEDDVESPQVAVEANTTEPEPVKEEPEEAAAAVEEEEELPELDNLSQNFNETFDPVQTAQVINPGLKSLLLKNPSFIVDFQDKKFLIYREYTFEAENYTTVLEMGQAILRNLNREIPAASKESQDAEVPIQFVSRSKGEDTP